MLNRLKFTLKSTFIYSIGNVGIKLIGLILLPIYTDKLTPEEYGMWSLLEITSQLLVMVVGLRLSTAVIRFYSENRSTDYKGKVVFTALITSLVSVILFNLFTQPFTEKYSVLFFHTAAFGSYFTFLIVWISFGVFNYLIFDLLRVKEKPVLYILGTTAKFITVLLLIIYLVAVKEMGISGIILGQLAGSMVLFFVFIPFLIREMKWKIEVSLIREMLQYSTPLILSGGATFFLTFGDRYLIKLFLNYREVGLYSLSYKISNVLKIILIQSFQLGFMPIAFSMFGKKDAKRFFSKMFTYYSFALLWAGLATALFSKEIIVLFSSRASYYDAYLYVPLLVMAIIFFGMQNYFVIGMHYAKKTRKVAVISVIVLLFNIVLNLLLIPLLKLYGAGISYIMTGLLMTILNYRYSQKYYNISYEIKKVLLMILLVLIIFSLSLLVNNFPILYSILIKILLILIFPVILYPLGFYEPVEIEKIKGFRKTLRNPDRDGDNME